MKIIMTTAIINWDNDTWRVLSTGTTDDYGRVYTHLASTTRFHEQRNGKSPIQICDFVPAEVLKAAAIEDKPRECVPWRGLGGNFASCVHCGSTVPAYRHRCLGPF